MEERRVRGSGKRGEGGEGGVGWRGRGRVESGEGGVGWRVEREG